jgi:hypothetical protein
MWFAFAVDEVIAAVAGAIAIATGVIAALAFLLRSYVKKRGKTTTPITLQLPRKLAEDERLKFGLLHVRDGKDQAIEQGSLLNKTYWFRELNGTRRASADIGDATTTLEASPKHAKALGFQFKCFRGVRRNGLCRGRGATSRGGRLRLDL